LKIENFVIVVMYIIWNPNEEFCQKRVKRGFFARLPKIRSKMQFWKDMGGGRKDIQKERSIILRGVRTHLHAKWTEKWRAAAVGSKETWSSVGKIAKKWMSEKFFLYRIQLVLNVSSEHPFAVIGNCGANIRRLNVAHQDL